MSYRLPNNCIDAAVELKQRIVAIESENTALKSQNEQLAKSLEWAMRNLRITFVKGGPREDVKEFKEAQQLLAEIKKGQQ